MEKLFESWIKFFGEPFTPRKLISLVTFLLLLGGALFIYEAYTSSFRLARLQKSAELLSRLQQIEIQTTNSSPEFQKAKQSLLNQVLIEVTPIKVTLVPSNLQFSMETLWKFLAGSMIWICVGIFPFKKWKTKDGRKDVFAIFFLAFLAGSIGVFVPPILWPWFHLLIYPFAFALIMIGICSPFLIPSFRTAREKAQTNTCLNNLRQLDGAAQQWALETGQPADAVPKKENLHPYLGSSSFPQCPLGGVYELKSVSSCPTCSIPTHKLPVT